MFRDFLEKGILPEEIPIELLGYDFGDKTWNGVSHYFGHVVTDADIRAKDPELDKIMREQLRNEILSLGHDFSQV